MTGIEAVLEGGSACEWYFPTLHSSADLDIVIQEVLLRKKQSEGILVELGSTKTGRCWSSPSVFYTIEVVGSTFALARVGFVADVSVAHAPATGKPFTLLSATMMRCDRAMAWEALPHSERDGQHTLLAVKNFPEKIDFKRARTVQKAESSNRGVDR